ncbi:MAG: hypothetical protein ABI874_00865 [Chloroflexota bacterium]
MSMKLVARLMRFALVIGLALGVQLWAALQWAANFDGDEAVFGLMARHVLKGEIAPYMWGQSYLGSLESWLAAGSIQLWGPTVLALRIPSLMLFGIFFILHGRLVYQAWGERVALISLLILALPPWLILWWTFKPVGDFGAMFVCGTAALVLARANPSRPVWHVVRVIFLGIVVGLGLWSHPLTVIYFAIGGVTVWLQMPEWAVMYERCAIMVRRRLSVSMSRLVPVVSLLLAGLLCVAFFTGGCTPQEWFVAAQFTARVSLFVGAAGLAVMMFVVSVRRRQWLSTLLCFSAGFALGNFPQWAAWLIFSHPPDARLVPSCPAVSRLRLVVEQVLPAMWGLPLLADLRRFTTLEIVTWVLIFPIILAALAAFIWRERTTLTALMAASPLAARGMRTIVFGLLLGLPIVFATLSNNTVGLLSVRYLLIAWQAHSVILATFLSTLAVRSRTLALMLLGLWLSQVGIGNLFTAGKFWAEGPDTFSSDAVSAVETFLQQNNVQGAYAEYFLAYSLDFLSAERLTIAPYSGLDRYPRYTERVDSLAVQAYLFWPDAIRADTLTREDMLPGLMPTGGAGPARPEIIERLRRQRVLERRRVANWDVWVVSDQ